MLGTLDLIDDRIYAERVVCQSLGIRPGVLEAARRKGELKAFKAGAGRRLYRGQWLREWIEAAGEPRQTEAAAC